VNTVTRYEVHARMAQVEHRCVLCERVIGARTRYVQLSVVGDEEPWLIRRLCPDCSVQVSIGTHRLADAVAREFR
jgi:hypothetical protein